MAKPTDLTRQAAEGVLDAPVIYFEGAPTFSIVPGVGRVTLETFIMSPGENGSIVWTRRVVAHLRGNAIAFAALRDAINAMEGMLQPPPSDPKQVN